MHSVVNYLLQNFIIFVFSRFRNNFFAENHSNIQDRTPKFLLEIMTLVLSANNIGPDKEFILSGRLFI
jgi:hypothetical protein